jgi:hypothetical protein
MGRRATIIADEHSLTPYVEQFREFLVEMSENLLRVSPPS